ncbi:ead/Ea22-like family protein [Enterobacter roggenkampii]
MSNIDKRALREAAKAVGKNDWQYVYTRDLSATGRGYITVGGAEAIYCLNKATGGVKQSENVLRYIAAANPATFLALLDELEAAQKLIDEQREIMRQAASDISYAIFNLTGSDLSRLKPGVIETTDPTDTALIAERNLRAAAAGKGE